MVSLSNHVVSIVSIVTLLEAGVLWAACGIYDRDLGPMTWHTYCEPGYQLGTRATYDAFLLDPGLGAGKCYAWEATVVRQVNEGEFVVDVGDQRRLWVLGPPECVGQTSGHFSAGSRVEFVGKFEHPNPHDGSSLAMPTVYCAAL